MKKNDNSPLQNEVREMKYKDFYVTFQKGCDPSNCSANQTCDLTLWIFILKLEWRINNANEKNRIAKWNFQSIFGCLICWNRAGIYRQPIWPEQVPRKWTSVLLNLNRYWIYSGLNSNRFRNSNSKKLEFNFGKIKFNSFWPKK